MIKAEQAKPRLGDELVNKLLGDNKSVWGALNNKTPPLSSNGYLNYGKKQVSFSENVTQKGDADSYLTKGNSIDFSPSGLEGYVSNIENAKQERQSRLQAEEAEQVAREDYAQLLREARRGPIGSGGMSIDDLEKRNEALNVKKGDTLGGIAKQVYGDKWKAGLALMMSASENKIKTNQYGSPIIREGATLVAPDLYAYSDETIARATKMGGDVVTNNDRGLEAKREQEIRLAEQKAAAEKRLNEPLSIEQKIASQFGILGPVSKEYAAQAIAKAMVEIENGTRFMPLVNIKTGEPVSFKSVATREITLAERFDQPRVHEMPTYDAENRETGYSQSYSIARTPMTWKEFGIGSLHFIDGLAELGVKGTLNLGVKAASSIAAMPALAMSDYSYADLQKHMEESWSADIKNPGGKAIVQTLGKLTPLIQETRNYLTDTIGDGATTTLFVAAQAGLELSPFFKPAARIVSKYAGAAGEGFMNLRFEPEKFNVPLETAVKTKDILMAEGRALQRSFMAGDDVGQALSRVASQEGKAASRVGKYEDLVESQVSVNRGISRAEAAEMRAALRNDFENSLRQATTNPNALASEIRAAANSSPLGQVNRLENGLNSAVNQELKPAQKLEQTEAKAVSATNAEARAFANDIPVESRVTSPVKKSPLVNSSPLEPDGCFVAGTMVWTNTGLQPIEQIRVGQLVLAQPEAMGEQEYRPVERTFVFVNKAIYRVQFGTVDGREETILATPNHPFFVKDFGWKAAESLQINDILELQDRTPARVTLVEDTGETQTVYNLSVTNLPTYYVGELGVWVHNRLCKAAKERIRNLMAEKPQMYVRDAIREVKQAIANERAAKAMQNLASEARSSRTSVNGHTADPFSLDSVVRIYDGRTLQGVSGKYIINDPRLVVDMPFVGKGASNKNAAGWLRDADFYWKEIVSRHPEAFSEYNLRRMAGDISYRNKAGELKVLKTPIVDAEFRKVFTQFDEELLRSNPMVHHHLGRGGQAVAVPKILHPGSGGIHNIEKTLGLWGRDDKIAELLQLFLK